jgi:hypothetical protein
MIQPMPYSTGDDSNFITISNDFGYDVTFYCVIGQQMCGNICAINHSLCYSLGIWNVNIPITYLNL